MLDENVDARLAFIGFSQASHIAEQMFLRFGDDEESQRRGTPGSGAGAVPRGKHRDVVGPSGCGAVLSAIASSPRRSLQSVREVVEHSGQEGGGGAHGRRHADLEGGLAGRLRSFFPPGQSVQFHVKQSQKQFCVQGRSTVKIPEAPIRKGTEWLRFSRPAFLRFTSPWTHRSKRVAWQQGYPGARALRRIRGVDCWLWAAALSLSPTPTLSLLSVSRARARARERERERELF